MRSMATYPVLSVSSKPLLAGGIDQAAIDHLPSLGVESGWPFAAYYGRLDPSPRVCTQARPGAAVRRVPGICRIAATRMAALRARLQPRKQRLPRSELSDLGKSTD